MIHELNIIRKTKKVLSYQDLSEKEKSKKWEYDCKRYENLSEHEEQRLVEYCKKYFKVWKKTPLCKQKMNNVFSKHRNNFLKIYIFSVNIKVFF